MEIACVGKKAYLACVLHNKAEPELSLYRLLILFVGGDVDGLGISEPVHDKRNVHLLEGLLLVDSSLAIVYLSESLSLVLLPDLCQLILDDHGH